MVDFALRSCGLRGHATFAPDEPELAARLHVQTPVGEAWRCLRCETFVVGPPRGKGPAESAPEVPRGRLLRDRVLMRVLAVERVFRFLLLAAMSYGVFRVRAARVHLRDMFEKDLPLLRPLADQIGWNIDGSKIIRHINDAFTMSGTTLLWIGIGIAVYALIELVEAVGLWGMWRWGEYFAVVATGIFLPLEIYELTEKVTALRVAMLLVNIIAVLWLLWSKRLFGLNGGGAAYRREHETESLMSVERAGLATTAP
ncbi:DUF2127 domain-containing protein [Mycolicibacterium phocaicum]|uniref:DUF2127 domain-containing protein n=1 Tax=Mycolicibacterium phocaicum TaxID=319706 RepID=A0A7I7ZGA0_9MYCO|nr:DUF2127 domain-containing protein [Mycolicibacterium phocaicum]TLH65002.1 DUF2127 domain-containing protein [Mycolicibacterium phocaicum]BBZ53060.1 hypothetical protein MPHO_00520 [Mycolicibacterium phocaicum]